MTVAHQSLADRAWPGEHIPNPRTVSAHIKAIRRKLGDNARRPNCIFTQHKVGYRLGQPHDINMGQSAAERQRD